MIFTDAPMEICCSIIVPGDVLCIIIIIIIIIEHHAFDRHPFSSPVPVVSFGHVFLTGRLQIRPTGGRE